MGNRADYVKTNAKRKVIVKKTASRSRPQTEVDVQKREMYTKGARGSEKLRGNVLVEKRKQSPVDSTAKD